MQTFSQIGPESAYFIDPPSTSAPLTRWQQFQSGLQKFPQDATVRAMLAWSGKVISAKQTGAAPPVAPEPEETKEFQTMSKALANFGNRGK